MTDDAQWQVFLTEFTRVKGAGADPGFWRNAAAQNLNILLGELGFPESEFLAWRNRYRLCFPPLPGLADQIRITELVLQVVAAGEAVVVGMSNVSFDHRAIMIPRSHAIVDRLRAYVARSGSPDADLQALGDDLQAALDDFQTLVADISALPVSFPVPAPLTTPNTQWTLARDTLEYAERDTVREAFVALFPPGGGGHLGTLSHAINGRNHPLLGQRQQPDVFIVRNTSPVNSTHVECVGRIGRASEDPGDYEKRRTFSYALALFRKQPNRRKAFAFFTNLSMIIYFKVSAKPTISAPDPDRPDDFDFSESPAYRLDTEARIRQNLQFLMSMFKAPNAADLGFSSPPVHDGIEATECFGSGVTSNVWLTDDNLVLKSYNPGFENLRDSEVETLQALQPPNIGRNQTVFLPTVVASLENAILMTPVLQHFRDDVRLSRQHITDLFDTLAHIHASGRVHRDLCFDNIKRDDLHAYIIDFGFAVQRTSDPVAFAGAKQTASTRVLAELLAGHTSVVYDYSDDVESLAKCIYLFRTPNKARKLSQLNGFRALFDFWNYKPPVWKAAFKRHSLEDTKNYILDYLIERRS